MRFDGHPPDLIVVYLTRHGVFDQRHLATHVTMPTFLGPDDPREFRLVCDGSIVVPAEDVLEVRGSIPDEMCDHCATSIHKSFMSAQGRALDT